MQNTYGVEKRRTFIEDLMVISFSYLPIELRRLAVRKKASLENKGELCCKLSCFWFDVLEAEGIKTHFREYVPPNHTAINT